VISIIRYHFTIPKYFAESKSLHCRLFLFSKETIIGVENKKRIMEIKNERFERISEV
jgi:hypothetical protein